MDGRVTLLPESQRRFVLADAGEDMLRGHDSWLTRRHTAIERPERLAIALDGRHQLFDVTERLLVLQETPTQELLVAVNGGLGLGAKHHLETGHFFTFVRD